MKTKYTLKSQTGEAIMKDNKATKVVRIAKATRTTRLVERSKRGLLNFWEFISDKLKMAIEITFLNKEIARAMRVETKTTISINDENPFALIHTTQQPLIQKLNSFCAKKYDNCIIDYKDDFTSIYTIPKEYVSIRHQQAISPLEETELNMIECQLTKAGRMTLIEYNVEYPYAVVYT